MLGRFEYTLIFFSFSIEQTLPVFAGRAVLLREEYSVLTNGFLVSVVSWHGDDDNGAKTFVLHAAVQPGVKLFWGAGGCDDGGQFGIITVVE